MLRRHPSLFLLAFVVPGIIISDQLRLPSYISLLAGFLVLPAALYYLYNERKAAGGVLLGLSLGLLAACLFSLKYVDIGPHHIKRVITSARTCRVYGRVADWPDLKPDRTEIKIAVDSLGYDVVRRVEGGLLLKVTDTTTALQRGDRIEFSGRIYPLTENRRPGQFDYGRFLNLKGVHGVVYLPTLLGVQVDRRSQVGYLSLVDDLRAAIIGSLNRNLTPVSAALSGGFLIGETRRIPSSVYTMFRDSGTLHLLAVSGSNVALVLLFCIFIMRPFWLGPTARSLTLLVIIVIFAGLSYGEPSVMRASIMAALVIIARLAKRNVDLNNIIALAALIILLADPAQLYDVGFQLSFATAWGLILLVGKLTDLMRAYHGRRWYRWVVFPFLIALTAQVCSVPIIAYYFGRVPAISVAANLVIVPMVSLGVIGILVLLIADLILPILGAFVGSLVDWWLNLVVKILMVMGGEHIPVISTGSLLEGAAGPLWVCLFYLLLVMVVWSITHKPARRLAIISLLLVTNWGLVRAVAAVTQQSSVQVEFSSVPGGIAAIVDRPDSDGCDLVLTGLTRRQYSVDERILTPLLQRRGTTRLDRLFLLSADYDVLGDVLRLAQAFDVSELFINEELKSSFRDARQAAGNSSPEPMIAYLSAVASGSPESGYYPDSAGLKLQMGQVRILFTDRLQARHFAGTPPDGETILVVGSKWSPSPDDWIRLHSLNYTRIICSKIEQAGLEPYYDADMDPDSRPPDFLHDLSRTGSYLLAVPAGADGQRL